MPVTPGELSGLAAIRDYLRPIEQELANSVDGDFLTIFNRQTRTRVTRLRLNVVDTSTSDFV